MSPTKLSNMVPSRKRSPVSLNNSLLTGDPHTARLTSVPSQIPADLCISQRASLAPDRLANSMTRKSGNKPNLRFGLLVQLKEHHLLTTHQDLNLPRSSSPFLVELQVSTRKWGTLYHDPLSAAKGPPPSTQSRDTQPHVAYRPNDQHIDMGQGRISSLGGSRVDPTYEAERIRIVEGLLPSSSHRAGEEGGDQQGEQWDREKAARQDCRARQG